MYKYFILLICLAFHSGLVNAASCPKLPNGSGSRIALLIGNQNYPKISTNNQFGGLTAPADDAKHIAQALKQYGFYTFLVRNANRRTMLNKINQFKACLAEYQGIGLFFFAGHGIQADDPRHGTQNYLLPVGQNFNDNSDIIEYAISAQLVLNKMQESGAKVHILLLDACRNRLQIRNSRGVAVNGFIGMNAKGALIGYAAAEGEEAFEDPNSKQGLYSAGLLAAMRENPHEPLELVLKYAGTKTANLAKNYGWQQEPWFSGSVRGNVCLQDCGEGQRRISYQAQGQRIKRYIAYDNGTAKDTVTGLLWMRCSVGQTWTGSGCSGQAKRFKWEQAIKQTANFAGYGDWRIPTIAELRSLVYCSNGEPDYFNPDYKNDPDDFWCTGEYKSPTIVQAVFPDTPSVGFWSGSPFTVGWISTWFVDFNNGHDYSYFRNSSRLVRLVRGGQFRD